MYWPQVYVLLLVVLSSSTRHLTSVRQHKDGTEIFGEFSTVRLKKTSGMDIVNCAGVRVAFDFVLTTRDCYDNKSIAFVQFESVKSYIRSHGYQEDMESMASESGSTKVKTYQYEIDQVYMDPDSNLVGLSLKREFPRGTLDIENLKQPPVFLDTEAVEFVESKLTAHSWKWTGPRDRAYLGPTSSPRLFRSSPSGIIQVTGLNKRQVSANFSCDSSDQQFYLDERVSPGSPILRVKNGMPILVGLATTATDSVEHCIGSLQPVISIAKSQPFINFSMTRNSPPMWYDPVAEYTTYVKGRQANKLYHKWWTVKYDEDVRKSIEKEEHDRLNNGAEDDEHARPITGIGYEMETLDAKHRYGMCLKQYYLAWKESVDKGIADPAVSFFEWYDYGQGRAVEVGGKKCKREHLERLKVKFCDSEERQQYEVEFEAVVENGISNLQLKYKQSGQPIFAPGSNLFNKLLATKFIFVWDLSKRFYVHKKVSGHFHHSSFVSGEPVYSAGMLSTTREGYLRVISPHSGHYKPTLQHMDHLKEYLASYGSDMSNVLFLTTTFDWLQKFGDFSTLLGV